MKAFPKFGLLFAVALVACAAVAASAQAVSISPDATPIEGIADDPTLNYGEQEVTCDTGTANGTTGTDSPTVFVDIDFQEPCGLEPLGLGATTTCDDGEFTELEATDGTANLGEAVELHPGFECTVVVAGICTLTVDDQTLPFSGGSNSANLINEGSNGDEAIDADVDVEVFNNNSLCGPVPSGSGGFAGVYELDTPVSFDP
jgi:hypothetical protein